MTIQRFHDEVHDQYSYLVHDAGEAIAIDPSRKVKPYFDYLNERDLRLVAIVMTHLPGAFASGWAELRRATGAEMIGATKYHFHGGGKYREAGRSTMIPFGDGNHLQTHHTPGYTGDSISVLAIDSDRKVHGIFTGATLLNMGSSYPLPRPDDKNPLHNQKTYAKEEYESIDSVIRTFDQKATVYSNFGEDAHFSKMGDSSHGHFNLTEAQDESPVFDENKIKNADQFAAWLLEDAPYMPAYVTGCLEGNQEGYADWANAMAPFREWLPEEDRPTAPTTTVIEEKLVEDHGNVVILEDTEAEIPAPASAPKNPRVPIGGENIVIVDTRDAADFKTGHAPGAINIQAEGPFALCLGSIIRPHESFAILIDNDDHAAGVAESIAKIGYDRQLVSAERWKEEPDHLVEQPLDMDDFQEHHIGKYTVVDVRPPEAAAEDTRFYGAINVPFWEMRDRWKEIPVDRPIVVHCGGGYHSAIGTSILRKHLGVTVPVYDLGDKIKDFKAKRDLD